MAVLMPQLDGGFHSQFQCDDTMNHNNNTGPLSPDLEEVNVAEILDLLNNTTGDSVNCSKYSPLGGNNSCPSEESGESDCNDISSPSWDPQKLPFPIPSPFQIDFTDNGHESERGISRRPSCPESPECPETPELNVDLRSGLSVQDITSQYDSTLIASRGMKRRGRKPSIKSWRRKNEYSELLKKVIQKYTCENTELKYEAMQLEKERQEMLKTLERITKKCDCKNTNIQPYPS